MPPWWLSALIGLGLLLQIVTGSANGWRLVLAVTLVTLSIGYVVFDLVRLVRVRHDD